MRVLADTNLFISYLLHAGAKAGSIERFFQALADGAFTLLMPQDLLDEIVATASNKPHLAQRIPQAELELFATLLGHLTTEIPRIEEAIPRVCRDPKDDYLLAYALVGKADYLVTGDRDLLVLGSVGKTKIVTAQQFLDELFA